MYWQEVYRGGTVMKKSPNAVGIDGLCVECTACKSGSCAYAMAGQELPCGKTKPDEVCAN